MIYLLLIAWIAFGTLMVHMSVDLIGWRETTTVMGVVAACALLAYLAAYALVVLVAR